MAFQRFQSLCWSRLPAFVLLVGAQTMQAAIETPNSFTLTETVSMVTVRDAHSPRSKVVAANTVLNAAAVLTTGPNARVEMIAQDGTVVRAGANTTLSVSPDNNGFVLEKGNVLMSTPTGKSGVIQLNGAKVSSSGATVMVSATKEGAFKTLVLDGKAKATLANGSSSSMKAGQMNVVMTGDKTFGPAANFRLAEQTAGAALVSGYKTPLPSISAVAAQVQRQEKAIAVTPDQTALLARHIMADESNPRMGALVRDLNSDRARRALLIRSVESEPSGVHSSNSTAAIGANTMVLQDTQFKDGSTVNLTSQQHLIAPNPGANQGVKNGMVNFVRNVFYGNTEVKLLIVGDVNHVWFQTAATAAGKNLSNITIGKK